MNNDIYYWKTLLVILKTGKVTLNKMTNSSKCVESNGAGYLEVEGEIFPSVLTEDGAEYTKTAYVIKRIVKGARTSSGKRIVNVEWENTWVEEDAFTDTNLVERFFEDHFDQISKANKKTHRGCRSGKGRKKQSRIEGIDI